MMVLVALVRSADQSMDCRPWALAKRLTQGLQLFLGEICNRAAGTECRQGTIVKPVWRTVSCASRTGEGDGLWSGDVGVQVVVATHQDYRDSGQLI